MPTSRFRHARWAVAFPGIVFALACHRSGTVSGAAPSLPARVTLAMVATGDTIFNTKSCMKCDGLNAVGTLRGPNLNDQTWIHIDGSYPAIVHLVTTGFTKAEQRDPQYPFQMNPRGGTKLTDDEINAVSTYVWSLSHPGAR